MILITFNGRIIESVDELASVTILTVTFVVILGATLGLEVGWDMGFLLEFILIVSI